MKHSIYFVLVACIFMSSLDIVKASSGKIESSSWIYTIPKVIVRNGIPLTFRKISNILGVTLYKHRRENTYVEVIDLSRATFLSTYEYMGEDGTSGEPTYQKLSLLDHVRMTRLLRPISVFNGQFFDPAKSASPLSFWLKDNGISLTYGADDRWEKKNIFIVNASGAEIIPFDATLWKERNDTFAMVNLDPNTSHYNEETIGRTFICIPKSEWNPAHKVLVYISESKSIPNAKRELGYWGCDPERTSMLDSSGSSQLWTRDAVLYGFSHKGKPDYRTFPHALVVASRRW